MGLRRPVHARAPYPSLAAVLQPLLRAGLAPEITLDRPAVAALLAGEGAGTAAALAAAGVRPSFHAPFAGVDPGAGDAARREESLAAMRDVLAAAAPLRPLAVVFHPGLPPGASGRREAEHAARAADVWSRLLPLPPGLEETWVVIENIYEEGPAPLDRLLGRLPSPPFAFCLDVGHARMFSRVPLEAWFDALGGRLREVHLHDNHGGADEHLPPGRGTVDFPRVLRLLGSLPQPVVGTLELNSIAEVMEGIGALRALGAA